MEPSNTMGAASTSDSSPPVALGVAQVPTGSGGVTVPEAARAAVAAELLQCLAHAVRVRVATVPSPPVSPSGAHLHWAHLCAPARVGVLFSGGVDCMIIAALCDAHVPPWEPVDLLNVSFDEAGPSPDRVTAVAGLQELQTRFPHRHVSLHCYPVSGYHTGPPSVA